jgi:hypothetical protein
MRNLDLRKFLGWIFAATALLYLLIYLPSNRYVIFHPLYAFLPPRQLIYVPFFVLVCIVSGVAWWTVWKDKPSARGWGVAASAVHILVFLRPVLFFPGSVWWHHMGALWVGIVGLAVFSPWYGKHESH